MMMMMDPISKSGALAFESLYEVTKGKKNDKNAVVKADRKVLLHMRLVVLLT